MYVHSGKSALKWPPTGWYASPASRGNAGGVNSPLLSLTEATSNAILPPALVCQSPASWARIAGAFKTPMTTGTTRAAIAAAPRASFFPRVSPATLRFLMIDSIRLLRSDPVTPDTHAIGEDKYNLQMVRML